MEEAEAREEALEVELNGNSGEEAEDESGTPKRKISKKDYAELLRRKVDTVGRVSEPGEQIQKVISVGMLSEGWDAKTVTHIMGLRAFTSQLLCEQVVGRGLRRTSYEVDPKSGLFSPEYVNIFGVPFTFLPHEGSVDTPPPPPPPPKTRIEPIPERMVPYELTWPNVIRIDHEFCPQLSLDLSKVEPLVLDASETRQLAEIAPIIDGKHDVTRITEINLEELGRRFRMQKIIFSTASDLYDQMQHDWKGSRQYLLAQLVRLVETFLGSDHIQIHPAIFANHDLRRRIVLTLNMSTIVQHMWEAVRYENALTLTPVLDRERPMRSTGDMLPWYTGKPCEHTKKSHINMCVYDSTWEASESFELDRNPNVAAWTKNDHLGFEIKYTYKGIVRDFRPDYLVRLASGKMLVLEVKGQDTQEQQTKRQFLAEWIRAVNDHGGFGQWTWDVSHRPGDVTEILDKHVAARVEA